LRGLELFRLIGTFIQMMNTPELRQECAERLVAGHSLAEQLTAFVGLDGFVDEIIHVVDKRHDATHFDRLPTIAKFAQRLAGAAGRSTNLELVTELTKLGGNGPIMGNALANLGLKVTYLGNLGYPTLHPVFTEFSKRAEVYSIAPPGTTDALEFDDGKIMMGKHTSLKEVNWENILIRFGRERFATKFGSSDLVGFVNWTMLPYMSDIWAAILKEICPTMNSPRRKIFFDLADPEKREPEDIAKALELIAKFEKYFDVILGMNEKESYEVAKVLGLNTKATTPDELAARTCEINARVKVNTVVVHPVPYALAVSDDAADIVQGPYVGKPVITTGAGDHFNSGFCLGKLLGFSNAMCVLTGVSTSGFYVRTAQSPNILQLADFMRNWPSRE
jgi:sugar/nucleoside kinase (ribokinase family)